MRRWRLLVGVLCLAAAAVVLAARGIDLATIRGWSAAAGTWFPLVFFCVYAVLAVLPIPRSTFTYAASVLFAPVVAIPLALGATALSCAAAFLGVRALGHSRAAGLRDHPRIAPVDVHLRRRGWPAVLFLRMVPAVPFSVLNYAAALSSVRFRPFFLASVAGSAPGTVAAILLGNAATTGSGGAAVWASVACAAVGLVGVVVDARIPTVEGDDVAGAVAQTGSVTKSMSRSTAPSSSGSTSL